MDHSFPLVVAVPLLTAAGLLAFRPLLQGRRDARGLVAVAASVSVAVMLAFLTVEPVAAERVLAPSTGSPASVRRVAS